MLLLVLALLLLAIGMRSLDILLNSTVVFQIALQQGRNVPVIHIRGVVYHFRHQRTPSHSMAPWRMGMADLVNEYGADFFLGFVHHFSAYIDRLRRWSTNADQSTKPPAINQAQRPEMSVPPVREIREEHVLPGFDHMPMLRAYGVPAGWADEGGDGRGWRRMHQQ